MGKSEAEDRVLKLLNEVAGDKLTKSETQVIYHSAQKLLVRNYFCLASKACSGCGGSGQKGTEEPSADDSEGSSDSSWHGLSNVSWSGEVAQSLVGDTSERSCEAGSGSGL